MSIISREAYMASFTPERISEFRTTCRLAAGRLLESGFAPTDVAVRLEVVEVPRRIFGFSLKSDWHRRTVVDLRGWVLGSFVKSMGQEGDEWYRWTLSAVLGEDGMLYQVESHEEQRRGVPTGDDGRTYFKPILDSEMDRWDSTRPAEYHDVAPSEYLLPFPGAMAQQLDALLSS